MILIHSLPSPMITPAMVIFTPYTNDLKHFINLKYLRLR
jgi:hypothetical protein